MIQTQQIERNRLIGMEHTAYNFVTRLPQFPDRVDQMVYEPLRLNMGNISPMLLRVLR